MKDKLRKYLEFIPKTLLSKEVFEKNYDGLFFESKLTDTQGYIMFNDSPEEIIIAFRGTEPKLIDWLTNFKFTHKVVPYNNKDSEIRVHVGFINAYKSVRGTIHNYLSEIANPKKVTIIGHSLGGALANLCAVDLQYNFKDLKISCYTYGAPRVGNVDFADSYNMRIPDTHRVYMRTDVVPALPFTWIQLFKGGYKHAGQEHPIGPNNIFVGIQNIFMPHRRLSSQLTNHSVELYRKYLTLK